MGYTGSSKDNLLQLTEVLMTGQRRTEMACHKREGRRVVLIEDAEDWTKCCQTLLLL
jgi:hypothetical protein